MNPLRIILAIIIPLTFTAMAPATAVAAPAHAGTVTLARGHGGGHGHAAGHSAGHGEGHATRGSDGSGHGEGTHLNEHGVTKENPDGDGTGTYVDTKGRTVHYRPVAGHAGSHECDANDDGKYSAAECKDMPETTAERREDERLMKWLVGVIILVCVLTFILAARG